MIDDEYLKLAIKYAKRSSIKRYQVGAVIRYGGAVVSQGWSHRSQIRYSQTPFSCHAELHAINRIPHRWQLQGATIYIAKIDGKTGNVVSGEPCPICSDIIYKVGIERVVHS